MEKIKLTEVTELAVSIIICLFAGFIGSIFTAPSIPTWYTSLKKPFFTPPDWLFAPVWTALFVLMGISLFLVWRRGVKDHRVKPALAVFAVQLILNILWSVLFFGLRSPLAGLIDISILWIAILVTILSFMKISKTAGLLLIPYILWVSLAAALNFSIWRLNA